MGSECEQCRPAEQLAVPMSTQYKCPGDVFDGLRGQSVSGGRPVVSVGQ